MKVEKKSKIVELEEVHLTLTPEEYEVFYHGIGKTSPARRIQAGMSEEEAEAFSAFFMSMPAPYNLEVK